MTRRAHRRGVQGGDPKWIEQEQSVHVGHRVTTALFQEHGRAATLGWADFRFNAQTASTATSTAPAHQRRGSANAETTPAGAPAAAADRTQRPDVTCEGKTG